MDVITISVRAALKRHGIPPDTELRGRSLSAYLANLIWGTNAAFATSSGGINRRNVADYADRLALGCSNIRSAYPRTWLHRVSLTGFVELYHSDGSRVQMDADAVSAAMRRFLHREPTNRD